MEPFFWFPVWFQVFSFNCRPFDSCLIELVELLQVGFSVLFRYFLLIEDLGLLWKEKSSQKDPTNIHYPQGSIFGPTIFLIYKIHMISLWQVH